MARTIDTGTENLRAEIDDDGIALITFDRPERRNAVTGAMLSGLGRALAEIETAEDARCVVLTGAGGAFCAGGDVKRMNERNQVVASSTPSASTLEARIADLRSRQRSVSLALQLLAVPVVAALPGAAAGAGLSIALAADLRVAAERAVLVTAFSGVGASGDFGGSWFLTRLVGAAKAKELYFRSPRLSATDAHALGLVNEVLPDEGFEDAALEYCRQLAARPPIALRYIKENINRALDADLATCLDAEAVAMSRTMSTEDHKEAAAAFVEKRQAQFRGR
jgi:2-(1,2-epoxy-1,2-dihydrophenyl)acetyl-CoA isomerase